MLNLFTLAPELIEWIDDIIIVLTVISGVICKLFVTKKKVEKELIKAKDELTKTTEELVKVINITPVKDETFLEIAETEALKGAALLLSKLIK